MQLLRPDLVKNFLIETTPRDTVGSVLPTDLLDKKDLAFWVQRIQALFPKYERLQPEETKTAFIRGFVSSPLYGGIAFPTLVKSLLIL